MAHNVTTSNPRRQLFQVIVSASLFALLMLGLGDVIIAIDDKQTKNVNDLLDVLDTYEAGDTVTVNTRRNGKEVQFEIALEALK